MDPTGVGLVVFAFTLGGTLAGQWLRARLPAHHLSDESKSAMNLGIGLVATMAALVLGLVTASAKASFDEVDSAVKHGAMQILTLDRLLARYGPESAELRAAVRVAVGERIDTIWPQDGTGPQAGSVPAEFAYRIEGLVDAIRRLAPHNEAQRALRARALDLAEGLLEIRWLVFGGSGSSVPLPFLLILLFWLTLIFASFGLTAPRNATVFAVLLVCSLSVASAVFLILEMDGPFDGVLRVSAEPLRFAHAHLNQ